MHKTIWSKMNHLQLKKSSKEFHNLKFTEVQYCKLFEICRSNNMLSLLIHHREQFKVQIYQNSMKWKPCTRILLSFIWTTAVRPYFGIYCSITCKCWKDNKRPKIVLTVKKWVLTEVYEFCKSLAHCTDYKMH